MLAKDFGGSAAGSATQGRTGRGGPMGRRGENRVKLDTSTVVVMVFGAVLSIMAAPRCLAQPQMRQGESIGGFGELPWGTTVEKARAIHPDLNFGRYAVEDGGRELCAVYFRRDETGKIEGVEFDSIEYLFRENRFFGIRAVMRSRIGPRSLITQSEESFSRLQQALVRRYGAPAKYSESYFTDFVTVTRVAQWDRPDAAVVLTYKGPEGSNEDQLIFELRGGGRH